MLLKQMFVAIVFVMGIFVLGSDTSGADLNKERSAEIKRVQQSLAKLASGEGDWKQFSITYNDLHAFHGGLTLTIDGRGKVTQKALRQKVGQPKEVSEKELKVLVELLQKHHAWQQKVAERTAVPDESRAHLTITYGNDSVTIWEWYNDLSANKRLHVIREAMKKSAWKSIPK